MRRLFLGGRVMLEYETKLWSSGYKKIAGIDVAGRGPLAGPVCAAAVILPEGLIIEGVNDSKKLTEKKREKLFDIIKESAIAYSIEFVMPEVIDEINIRQATHLAMENAVKSLKVVPDFLIVDGNDNIPFSLPSEYIIKGDAKSQTIAAASILAKVLRDRYMCDLDKDFPMYCFSKHKGYGTKVHMEAIQKYGVSSVHRKTFMTEKVLGLDK